MCFYKWNTQLRQENYQPKDIKKNQYNEDQTPVKLNHLSEIVSMTPTICRWEQ